MKKIFLKYLLTCFVLLVGCDKYLQPDMYAGSYYANGYSSNYSVLWYPRYDFVVEPINSKQVKIVGMNFSPNTIATLHGNQLLINDTIILKRNDLTHSGTVYEYEIIHETAALNGEELDLNVTIIITVTEPSLLEPYGMGVYKETIRCRKKAMGKS